MKPFATLSFGELCAKWHNKLARSRSPSSIYPLLRRVDKSVRSRDHAHFFPTGINRVCDTALQSDLIQAIPKIYSSDFELRMWAPIMINMSLQRLLRSNSELQRPRFLP